MAKPARCPPTGCRNKPRQQRQCRSRNNLCSQKDQREGRGGMSPSAQHRSSPAPPPHAGQVGKPRSHTATAAAEHVQESTKGLQTAKNMVTQDMGSSRIAPVESLLSRDLEIAASNPASRHRTPLPPLRAPAATSEPRAGSPFATQQLLPLQAAFSTLSRQGNTIKQNQKHSQCTGYFWKSHQCHHILFTAGLRLLKRLLHFQATSAFAAKLGLGPKRPLHAV